MQEISVKASTIDQVRAWSPWSALGCVALVACTTLLAGCEGLGRSPGSLVQAPPSCATRTLEIYFSEGQSELVPSARQALNLTATSLQSCDIRSVKVTGLADSSGSSDTNLSLSQARARVVAQALQASGWPRPVFELEAAGDAGAMGPGGVAEPLRRRTEVIIEAVPK